MSEATVSKSKSATKSKEKSKKGKGKDKKKRKQQPKHRFTAENADKFLLYQLSVNSADVDVDFLEKVYAEHNPGKSPLHLREDFCGTHAMCAEWVKRDPQRTAEGYDLDPEPVDWGKQHNLSPLGDEAASRVSLYLEDARNEGRKAPDIRVAQNFSYWLFMKRKELLDYFQKVHASLAPGGIFVCDLYGGTESVENMEEERKIDGGFTYVWDQDLYKPGTAEFTCHIHFRFRDGSEYPKAFTYVWRKWGMAELKDLLADAGFSSVRSYFEGEDEDDPEEGDGIFEHDEEGDNCESWIAYLVSQK